MLKSLVSALACCLLSSAVPAFAADPSDDNPAEPSPVTIYTAQKVITMEPGLPSASAVAVADGMIVGVGSEESLAPWVEQRGGRVDRTLEDKVLMPGFIDPHVHPSLPAVLTLFPFLAPDDWRLPSGDFPGARTPQDYRKGLARQVESHFTDSERDKSVPFISWGYHHYFHGDLSRSILDRLAPDFPVIIRFMCTTTETRD